MAGSKKRDDAVRRAALAFAVATHCGLQLPDGERVLCDDKRSGAATPSCDCLVGMSAAFAAEKLSARNNAAGGGKSKYPPEPYDWYVEEGWTSDLLFAAESFKGEIVDPACGLGTIPARAIAAGYKASGSDLIDRPRIAEFPFRVLDFLGAGWDGCQVDNITCNSPYSYQKGIAEAFIRRALQVARRKVAMLLPVKFNSSNGRYALFTGTPLKTVYTLSSRPSMPPGSLLVAGKITAKGGMADYCWMVWERGYVGDPTSKYLILPDKLEAQLKKRMKEAA